MPIYEYACATCGHRFELRQRFSDEPVEECPECGSSVHRVFHPTGIIFKGSGWYITDSRKSTGAGETGDGKPAGSEAPSTTTKETTSTTTKTEAVPAAADN